jgi:hypothetical protein
MKKPKKGELVTRKNDLSVGTVTRVHERGVAGSACTYIEWIEVTYPNGDVVKGDPHTFVRLKTTK